MLPRTQNSFPRRLSVKWSSTRWRQRIDVIAQTVSGPEKPNPFGLRRKSKLARHSNEVSALSCPSFISVPSRKPRALHSRIPIQLMNVTQSRHGRFGAGFTLIELLVVISIIGVLASMALPVLGRAKVKAQVTKATMEINDINGAINSYYNTYSRMPASRDARESLDSDATPDFTYGTFLGGGYAKNKKGAPQVVATPNVRLQRNNSEVIAILKDLEQFRNGANTVNVGHSLNPQKLAFLAGKEVDGVLSPGIGRDGVYRDPWGMPYIISMDMNGDERCRDGFYGLDSVSRDPAVAGGRSGLNGLFKQGTSVNTFESRTSVMVWSMGPDRSIDSGPANKNANKDNILSWK